MCRFCDLSRVREFLQKFQLHSNNIENDMHYLQRIDTVPPLVQSVHQMHSEVQMGVKRKGVLLTGQSAPTV